MGTARETIMIRSSLMAEPCLRAALRELYAAKRCSPRVWSDAADPAYPGICLIEQSIALLAPCLDGALLDVGCGRQPYARYFAHVANKRACDFDASRGHVDFACPADRIPLPNASLDSIVCTEVLEHVPDPRAVWQEFGRLVKPGGKVLLATPMYWPGHEEPFDFFRYTGHGLVHLAESAEFDVIKLYPRGGVWAFLAQAIQHAIPQYLRWRWQRWALNSLMLRIDRWRCNPKVTIGWTILAQRR
jgi:SAM-dependent methyltransferase